MSKIIRSFVVALFASVLSLSALAQIAQHFGSQVTALTASGTQAYTNTAIDASGNIYISDQINSVVYKATLSGGVYTQSTILDSSFGLKSPLGIAVDVSGNLYIADQLNSRVVKETLSGGVYAQSVIFLGSGGNFVEPNGIAIDSNGNLYVSGMMYSFSLSRYLNEVFELTPNGATYTLSTLALTGLETPVGLAVDSANNLYVVDGGYPRVVKETFSGSTITQSIVVDDSTFNWLDQSASIAVDKNGNVFIGNGGPGGYDANTVVEAVLIGGSYQYRLFGAGYGTGVGSVYSPVALSTDSNGNVFISTAATGKYLLLEVSTPSTNFGSVALGSSSAVMSMPFTFSANTTAPQAGAAVSSGAAGEFVDVGTGSCDTNGTSKFYTEGQSCTVNVKFTPKYAGSREGAVQVVNTSGVLIAEAYVTGVGLGPQITFNPGVQASIGTGFTSPTSVAVDGNGVVYVLDSSTDKLWSETPSGSSFTQATIGYTVYAPTTNRGLAVNGADEIYINDPVNNFVVQLSYISSLSGYQQNQFANSVLGDGLSGAQGISLDGSGNLYIADTANNRVVEDIYTSGSTFDQPVNWQIVVASGLNKPQGVATDATGNVYIADTGNNQVVEETLTGLGLYTQSVVVNSGLSGPQAVLVDGVGNVYIADTGNKQVLKETLLSGGGYAQSVMAFTGLSGPTGLALDGSGNLYVADPGSEQVLKLTMAGPPTLSFAATAVGSTSSDSPQTVSLVNAGNQPLTFPIPATGTNASVSTGFTLNTTGGAACPALTTSSGSAGSLAANTSCNLVISFSPAVSGITSGSVVETDNDLNVASSTQTISLTASVLSGPAVSLTPATFGYADTLVGATSTAQMFTLSNTGTGTLTISSIALGGANSADFIISSNTCTGTLAAGSNCMISVGFKPLSAAPFAATLTVSDDASGSPHSSALSGTGIAPIAGLTPLTFAFANTTVGSPSTAQAFTLANTGTAPLTIASIVLSDTTDFSVSTTTCSTTTPLAASSSCTISVVFNPGTATSLSSNLTVTDDAGTGTQVSVLSGTGTAAPVTDTLTASASFGNQPEGTTSAVQALTLTNTGTTTVNITSITVGGTNAANFTKTAATTCGATLAKSTSCTIYVTFSPTTNVAYTATITVVDNATTSPHVSTLTGTGTYVAPTVTLLPTPLAFGTISVGSKSAAQTLTLTNTGTSPFTIASSSVTDATDYSFTTTCSGVIPPSGTCTVAVTFQPASAVALNATLSIVDSADSVTATASLTGTGQAVATDFGITSSTAAQSVSNGGVAQFTITVNSLGGTLAAPVVLSVSGLPTGATASFNPASLTPGSGAATSVLSIHTPSLLAMNHKDGNDSATWFAGLLLLPLLGLGGIRRRLAMTSGVARIIFLMALGLSALLPLSGCGGGYFGASAHTSTLTVTGTSGAVQHSATITLTVQ